ncbi:Serine_threonine-protein kinase PknD [Streptomyces sp. enrichment culture]|uniref:serine/threonine-protein kinase n=1 Tax=Streptomyces sp. enrichment culture TaxID=1795815 RepID=UPI003F5685EC
MSNDGGGAKAVQGRLVGGRYRLVERIGSGGSGTVWRAHDESAQREVAVKQPRLPGAPQDEEHRRAAHRLHREARAAARVDHPAAVTILDVVVEPEQPGERPRPLGPDELDATELLDGLPWIVMELVPGESLHDTLRRGPLEPREAARIGLHLLGALRAAHAVGIVHRDVTPANVLLGPHRRVVLTDFGIAPAQGDETPTARGERAATPRLVAPERLSGRIAGPASDLWSLGVLLYAAVEGSAPFRPTGSGEPLAAILAAEPPEPHRAGPLGPLLARLLVPDPERRPDAEEVAKELEAVAAPAAPGAAVPPAVAAAVPPTAVVPPAAAVPPTAVEAIPPAAAIPPAQPEAIPPAAATAIPLAQPEAIPAGAATPPSAEGAAPTSPPEGAHPGEPGEPVEPAPAPAKRQTLPRPRPLALLSALLAGGMGAATHLAGTGSAEAGAAEHVAEPAADRVEDTEDRHGIVKG